MTRDLLLAALVATVLAAIIYGVANAALCWLPARAYCPEIAAFGAFYGERLRGSLFAGFLTLGGFLLSLKTFIVVNMKKEVFDTEEYLREWRSQKLLDVRNKMGGRFDPLRLLSQTIFLAIASCVFTAVLQLTLGLAETWWAAAICLWACIVSMIFLGRSLWLIRVNLNSMFDFLDNRDGEREKQEKEEEARAQAEKSEKEKAEQKIA
ncbi:hypothetical protein [Stenotrophomonas geniculata]|uniref:hypothetical protein n=1 Tax=Stenotrophomonas geniculata TaxID=86188 RepID=UPI0039C68A05